MYSIWKNMNWRCDENKGHPAYIKKGIKVCQEWSEDNPEGFNNFLRDMYPRPDKLTIERIDNSKGYSKENCKWADMKEQQNNRENNHVIVYDNREWTVQQIADHLNIKSNTIICRLKRGWTVDEAISGERVREYRRPYLDKLDDEQFFNMLYELFELKVDQVSVGKKYGVSRSNLSRVTRDSRVIKIYSEWCKV
jgi:hypothetical protein